jgi:predicted metal-dependent RNase
MDTHEAVVKIDGGADVVGDDRDTVTYTKAPRILSEAQHAMLLPHAHDAR